MPASELRRFDLRVLLDSLDCNAAQLSFFGLGATVKANGTIPTGSSTLAVHDTGALKAGSTVQVGLSSSTLSVSSVDSSTQITVVNGTATPMSVSAGTRLLLTSDPITVYSDAAGSTPISGTNSLSATSGSPAAIWIPRPLFDFSTVPIAAVDSVATPATPLNSAVTTMTWNHTASGNRRLVLVGISWQESTGEETIDSVSYGGVAMTLLTSASYGAVYYLINPQTGPKQIVVTWSGSNGKGAVAGSVSYTGIDQASPFVSYPTSSGSSASPSLTIGTNAANGQIFELVSIQDLSSSPTLTATTGSGITQRWNAVGGSSGTATLTQGGSTTRASTGSSVTPSWTLSGSSPSRSWSMIGVALRPAAPSITVGTPGGVMTGAHAVDARNYASLRKLSTQSLSVELCSSRMAIIRCPTAASSFESR